LCCNGVVNVLAARSEPSPNDHCRGRIHGLATTDLPHAVQAVLAGNPLRLNHYSDDVDVGRRQGYGLPALAETPSPPGV
jgi:hypothetical protein